MEAIQTRFLEAAELVKQDRQYDALAQLAGADGTAAITNAIVVRLQGKTVLFLGRPAVGKAATARQWIRRIPGAALVAHYAESAQRVLLAYTLFAELRRITPQGLRVLETLKQTRALPLILVTRKNKIEDDDIFADRGHRLQALVERALRPRASLLSWTSLIILVLGIALWAMVRIGKTLDKRARELIPGSIELLFSPYGSAIPDRRAA